MMSGIVWVRMDAARAAHPKVRAAGFWGKVAWEALIDLAKLYGRGGKIGAHFCTGQAIADWLDPKGEVAGLPALLDAGVTRARTAGLLEDGAPNGLAIHDWPDYQRDTAAAERVKKWREEHSTVGVRNGNERRTRNALPYVTPTGQDGTGQDGTESTCVPSGTRASQKQPTPPKTTAREDYIDGIAAKIAAIATDEYRMACSCPQKILRKVAGRLVKVAKGDGYGRDAATNTAEVLRLVRAYYTDLDEWLVNRKHPLSDLLTQRVDKYRRPVAGSVKA